ncbi:MAG: NAD-dependent epimerase/dehydratase family protein [Alphaproteobacteria bacterium]|nr:NAD-dependent epimerase/dehydratase family protein [Alphaproteobacteria bacterium]
MHPLSQIAALVGEFRTLTAVAGPPIEIAPGQPFFNQVSLSVQGASVPAQLHFAIGGAFSCQQVVAVCDDGVMIADLQNNRCLVTARSRWLEAANMLVAGQCSAAGLAFDAARGAVDYGLSLLRVRPRSDAFFHSMRASVGAFHDALAAGAVPVHSGAFGAHLVAACEAIAAAAFPAAPTAPRLATATAAEGADVVLLGGTGFIGQATVRALVATARRVAVMARGVANLPAVFHDAKVTVLQGDVRRPQDVERAIRGVPLVVNLAHGGGGGSWVEVERSMVGSARLVAEACRALGVKRLVHVGSIAALYLGEAGTTVTGATPVDGQAEERAEYARGKAVTDALLLAHARCRATAGGGAAPRRRGRRGRGAIPFRPRLFQQRATLPGVEPGPEPAPLRAGGGRGGGDRGRARGTRGRGALLQPGRRCPPDRPRLHRRTVRRPRAPAPLPCPVDRKAAGDRDRQMAGEAHRRPGRALPQLP